MTGCSFHAILLYHGIEKAFSAEQVAQPSRGLKKVSGLQSLSREL